MALPVRAHRCEKVVCYVVREGQLLVFRHLDHPIEQAGIQVPAGTVEPGEEAADAALREASEESGLTGLRLVAELGEDDYDIWPVRDEVLHRRYFLLSAEGEIDLAARWEHADPDPTGGGPTPRWECFWIPLFWGHGLSGGQGRFVGAATDLLDPGEDGLGTVTPGDRTLLEEATLGNINWNGPRFAAREVVERPEFRHYTDLVPGRGDLGVRMADGSGVAWAVLLPATDPGFGWAGEGVPELSVWVREDRRGRGLGTRLLRELLDRAHRAGFARISLSVEDGNPARRLYERLGFVAVPGREADGLMVRDLT